MLINVRSGQIDGSLPEAIGFAVGVAETVKNATGVELGVWQSLYGRPLGTIAWSVTVESIAELVGHNQKLAEDADYLAQSDAARSLFIAGSFEDQLTNVVHTAGTPGTMAFVQAITAVAAPGKQGDAMAWGIEMADYASGVSGNAVTFGVRQFAEAGQIGWIMGYGDAGAIDASQAALSSDAGYQERLAAGAGLIIPGTASSMLSQRLN